MLANDDMLHELTLNKSVIRHDWSRQEIQDLHDLPFNDLIHAAHSLHRRFFDHNEIQLSTLLNIKTGGCPEDCAYCPQSIRYKTHVKEAPMLDRETVLSSARAAREKGATRFCMGAAWRSPKEKDFIKVLKLVSAVKGLDMETCATLGMLSKSQAARLKQAGLDFYNHNLDTSPEFYGDIISTRNYQDRLDTLRFVREAGIHVCCGGIVGMGESVQDRIGLLMSLANLPQHPESVPVNMLVRVEGTPLSGSGALDPLDMIRIIALTRILMPASYVRLSAGRNDMTDAVQALCFYAGANSVFFGEKLLTTDNPQQDRDLALMKKLGLRRKH